MIALRAAAGLLATTALLPVAHADVVHTVRGTGEVAAPFEFVATAPNAHELQFARQALPPREQVTTGTVNPDAGDAALAQSRIVYLNKNGVTLTAAATNDARANRSTIAAQTTTIPAWNVTPTVWTQTVACVKEIFAPFGVTIVETDPGNVPHIEAVFGGSPQQLGLPSGVAGVSPFTQDCSVIENSIVFTFTNVLPANDPRLACEIQAQEIAHSYGLDHELLAADPMTYLPYNGNRAFQNVAAQCGEDTARPCGIGGSTCRPNQNSVALLKERLGTRDAVAPTVAITSPANGAVVAPGFTVAVTASDDVQVASARLLIDGVAVGMPLTAPPWQFTTPADLAEGNHTLLVEVSDGTNVQPQQITVSVHRAGEEGEHGEHGGGGGGEGGGGGGGTGGGAGESEPTVDVVGGCSTSGGSAGGLLLGIALLGGAIRRRR